MQKWQLVPVSLCLLGGVWVDGAENSLEKNSPFIPSTVRGAGAVGAQDIEFRGVMQMGDGMLFSLFDKTQTPNKSVWLDPTDNTSSYHFKEYNEAEKRLTIEIAGKTHNLILNKPSDKPGNGAGAFGGGAGAADGGMAGFPGMPGMPRIQGDAMGGLPGEGGDFVAADDARFGNQEGGGMSAGYGGYGRGGASNMNRYRGGAGGGMANPYAGGYGNGGYANRGAAAGYSGIPSYEDDE
jgi:hypothetical protein